MPFAPTERTETAHSAAISRLKKAVQGPAAGDTLTLHVVGTKDLEFDLDQFEWSIDDLGVLNVIKTDDSRKYAFAGTYYLRVDTPSRQKGLRDDGASGSS